MLFSRIRKKVHPTPLGGKEKVGAVAEHHREMGNELTRPRRRPDAEGGQKRGEKRTV